MITKPYLIQRCEIKKDVKPTSNQKFSDRISLEYMGSSEFEDGIVARTLAAMAEKNLVISTHDEFQILSTDLQAMPYKGVLSDLKDKKIQTKEYVFTSFGESRTDLWIDLDNQIIFTTDKKILKQMVSLLENSHREILRRREVKKLSEEIFKKEDLGAFQRAFPNRTLFLCHHEVGDCPGTEALKEKTKFPVVYWLNDAGGYRYEFDMTGFYTVEDLQEYVIQGTGKVANRIEESKQLKNKNREMRKSAQR